MVTALRTSESVSNPSTNSPMIRSTRHGSVWVNDVRRSSGGIWSSRSSSVTAVRGEPLERCDMVVLLVIEERREADMPGAGIRDDPAVGQMPDRRRGVRRGEHDDRRARRGIGGHLGPEAPRRSARDQILGERGRHRADCRHPDLLDVLEAPQLRVHRRQGRRPQLEAARVVVKGEPPGVERELVPMPEPAGDGRLEAARQLFLYIREHDARSPQQPLEPARREDVHPGGPHVHRHLADGLVGIDQAQRPLRVSRVRHGADVLDRAAREIDVRRGHQRRALVDRPGDRLDGHAHLVGALHHDQLHPTRPLGEPLVGDRGKIEGGHHHPGPLRVIERLRDGRHRHRNAGGERDLRWRRADEARVARAQIGEARPPHVVPGGGPAALPQVQEFGYLPAGPLTQGAQRAGVEVDAVPEDRELAPVARQGVRGGASGRAPRQVACQGHRRSIYRWNDDARELAGLLRAPGAPGRRAPAARARSPAARLELPRARLVARPPLPAAAAPRVPALADVHGLRRRERHPAGRGRGQLRPLATRDDGTMNASSRSVELKRRASSSSVELKRRALAMGFTAVGVAKLEKNAHAAELDHWLAAGYAGTMTYLHRQAAKRKDPARILPGARVAVVTLTNYWHGSTDPGAMPRGSRARIAQYAWSADYHAVVGPRLERLAAAIRELAPGAATKSYVDAGPVPERELAQQAGLGWIGKNMMLIDPARGSFTFIGVVLTDAALAPALPFDGDRCGTCRRCLDACPTQAFVGAGELDARRCISYLTIERRGDFTATEQAHVGEWLFGCDVCQDVCPWNEKFAVPARDAELAPDPAAVYADPEELLAMDDATFAARYGDTPFARPGAGGMRRNAAAVLANRAP